MNLSAVTETTTVQSNKGCNPTWEPTDSQYITPTLVILCGFVSSEEAQLLQDSVLERLVHIPSRAIRWGQINSIQEITENNINQLVEPLLELTLWQELASSGYVQGLPAGTQRVPLQVIVVCDLQDGGATVVSSLVQDLEKVIGSALSGRVDLSLPLVLLGSGLDLGQTLYWPRVHLQTVAYGGVVADRARVLEACQTLLVAFIASELMRAMANVVGGNRDSVAWIEMGAAALVVDLARMRTKLHLLVSRELTHRVLGTQLAFADREAITHLMQEKVAGFQEATLAHALNIAARHLWNGKTSGRHIQHFTLSPSAELWKKIYPPTTDLASSLSNHYITLRDSLIKDLAQPESEQYSRLLDVFAFLLDRLIFSSNDRPLPVSLQEPYPSGLYAALHAVEGAIDELKNSPDMYFDGKALLPHPIGNDYFLTAVAESDAIAAHANFRRYVRLSRAMLSPLGLLLKVLPAWPLLTGALLLITTRWNELQSALVAGLSLMVIGVSELALRQFRVRGWFRRLRDPVIRRLAGSVLCLMAKPLRDFRLLIVRRLMDSLYTFKRLLSMLQNVDLDVQKRLDALDTWHKTSRQQIGSVYRLVDFEICHEWASQAIKRVDASQTKYANFVTAFVAEHIFPLFRNPSSPRHVMRRLTEITDQLVASVFRNAVLEVYVLSEREEPLKGGKSWQWLYQRAHPLGQSSESTQKSFTIMALASDAALVGAAGQHSEYWGTDWLVARSRQAHEIICLRGVFEQGEQEREDNP
ncbi:MAG: hypothetical protein FJ005_08670 [Chloroflexi bacterium]|nr:hypothetical protein [Chloroflexota bacterium]